MSKTLRWKARSNFCVAHQVEILAAPFRVAAYRDLRRFHQQEAHQRVALFGDVAQPSPLSAGVLQRHQSQIARDLLATLKPLGSPDDQHKGQRGQCTHSGVCLQAPCFGTLLHFLLDRLRQLGNRRSELIQQLQQIVPTSTGPRG